MLTPILDRLAQKRVFKTELSDDKTEVEFYDMCDECFGTMLTKADVLQLIEELKDLANQMK